MFGYSPVLESISPPREAILLHRAITLLLLAAIDDEDRNSLGIDHQQLWQEIALDARLSSTDHQRLTALWENAVDNDFSWIYRFLDLLPEDDLWTDLVCFDASVFNAAFDEEQLLVGPLGARLGTLLELCRFGATPFEVQTAYANWCEIVSDGKPSDVTKYLISAGELGASFAWGYFTGSPFTGPHQIGCRLRSRSTIRHRRERSRGCFAVDDVHVDP